LFGLSLSQVDRKTKKKCFLGKFEVLFFSLFLNVDSCRLSRFSQVLKTGGLLWVADIGKGERGTPELSFTGHG